MTPNRETLDSLFAQQRIRLQRAPPFERLVLPKLPTFDRAGSRACCLAWLPHSAGDGALMRMAPILAEHWRHLQRVRRNW